jgi:GNAT superfamily N-acetyltransferase
MNIITGSQVQSKSLIDDYTHFKNSICEMQKSSFRINEDTNLSTYLSNKFVFIQENRVCGELFLNKESNTLFSYFLNTNKKDIVIISDIVFHYISMFNANTCVSNLKLISDSISEPINRMYQLLNIIEFNEFNEYENIKIYHGSKESIFLGYEGLKDEFLRLWFIGKIEYYTNLGYREPQKMIDISQIFVPNFEGVEYVVVFYFEGNKVTGFSYVFYDTNRTNKAYQKFTYVCPKFRNKGISSKVKEKLYQFLLCIGIKEVITSTYNFNQGMLNVNEKLGFQTYFSEYIYVL